MTEKASGALCDRKNEAKEQINTVFADLFEKLKDRKQALLEDVDIDFAAKLDQIRKPFVLFFIDYLSKVLLKNTYVYCLYS